MTCILFHQNTVYADSKLIKGDERFCAVNKINGFSAPKPFKSTKQEIDDQVLGWVCTGSLQGAQGFISGMATYEDVDQLLFLYGQADTLNLFTAENHYEIYLFGVKKNYRFIWSRGPLKIEPLELDVFFTLGSGFLLVAESIKTGADPIAAMHRAAYMDEGTGGLIDVWKIKREGHLAPLMYRYGFCDELDPDEIAKDIIPNMTEKRNVDFVGRGAAFMDITTIFDIYGGEELELATELWKERKAEISERLKLVLVPWVLLHMDVLLGDDKKAPVELAEKILETLKEMKSGEQLRFGPGYMPSKHLVLKILRMKAVEFKAAMEENKDGPVGDVSDTKGWKVERKDGMLMASHWSTDLPTVERPAETADDHTPAFGASPSVDDLVNVVEKVVKTAKKIATAVKKTKKKQDKKPKGKSRLLRKNKSPRRRKA